MRVRQSGPQIFCARGSHEHTLFWGGYPDAERVFFGAFPDFMEPDAKAFPIAALTAAFRRQDRLTHRDFLGALLHAGLERSSLGDILTEEGRAVIFCRREVSGFLCTQVEKIGGVGVQNFGRSSRAASGGASLCRFFVGRRFSRVWIALSLPLWEPAGKKPPR